MVNKQLHHTYCAMLHKVKANIFQRNILFKTHVGNAIGRLISDCFLKMLCVDREITVTIWQLG